MTFEGKQPLGRDHAYVLLLGWYNKTPSQRMLDRAKGYPLDG
ncbi:MAG: hypothetical protein ACQEQ7_13045 [Thermodesulfobacteriota bacterium]